MFSAALVDDTVLCEWNMMTNGDILTLFFITESAQGTAVTYNVTNEVWNVMRYILG